jgi:hypothetical protein
MIVVPSEGKQTHNESEFIDLLKTLDSSLQGTIAADSAHFKKFTPIGFEEFVYDSMCASALGTQFEGNVEYISGQRFPDIVARIIKNGGFGLEVKATSKGKWVTTGNSIFESTRVSDVDRIYLCMGQLIDPGAFKIRSYDECLSDIKITHSPRYTIDMCLESGSTIFDKLRTSYDHLRLSKNPLKEFKKHYREHVLKEGEAVWWLDGGKIDEDTSELDFTKLIHFNVLPPSKKSLLMAKMFFLFPEVLEDKNQSKYYRCVEWLLSQGILNHAMRDTFSAGGKVNFNFHDNLHRIPKVLYRLYTKRDEIMRFFRNPKPHEHEVREYWNYTSGNMHTSSLLLFWKRKVVQILKGNESVQRPVVPVSSLIDEWFKT